MTDFKFCIPTTFVMGEDSWNKTGSLIKEVGCNKVLIVWDGNDFLADLVKKVICSIEKEGLTVLQMDKKATRPLYSLVLDGAAFCIENEVDFVLAIGGGTVMDTAKAIGFFASNAVDIKDYALYRKFSPECLKLGSIVTLAGTGSEVSATAMIIDDREEPSIKYPLFQDSMRFNFSIMDPSLTYSLPIRHTLAGAFDSITHIMEHYFNGPSGFDLQNRMCEAVMKSILVNMKKIIEKPDDYETRAQLMMGSTLANSTLLGLGCESDWACHYMENPVTTYIHCLHGEGLSVIVPAWMRYCYKKDLDKAVRFATSVMDIPNAEDQEAVALDGIRALETFIKEVGLPLTLGDLNVSSEMYESLANNSITTCGQDKVGGISCLTKDEVINIYKIAGTEAGNRR